MSVATQRAKYVQKTYEARAATVQRLSPYGEIEFTLTEWSGRAFEAAAHWDDGYYDWREINRKVHDPDRLDLALWVGDRLVAMCVATTMDRAVYVELVAADTAEDCPLGGSRLEILLDACANYAQIRGKTELRLHPKNEKLTELYETVYGFTRFNMKGNTPYWSRKV